MNRKRLFLIALAAVIVAGILTMVTFRAVHHAPASVGPPMAKIVVAATDLGTGVRIAERDVRIVDIPMPDAPAGAYNSPDAVVGRGVITPIVKNEPLLDSKLASVKAGSGLPSIIPQGMRAVSVRVNDVTSVAGFVVPGTRVDVLLTGNPGGHAVAGDQVTTTVLENVAVLAADQKLERQDGGKPQQVAVVTLQVSPTDAQRLTLAAQGGHIQLVLRNPVDAAPQNPASVSQSALYRMTPASAAPALKPKHTSPAVVVEKVEPPTVEVIRGNKRDIARF